MSTQYKDPSEVPTSVICTRLKELSDYVTKGRESVAREFTMRIPAEVDRDADIVLHQAAKRLAALEAKVAELEEQLDGSLIFINQCDKQAIEALRYLATHQRPSGGQEKFNAEHLLQIASELMASTANAKLTNGAE